MQLLEKSSPETSPSASPTKKIKKVLPEGLDLSGYSADDRKAIEAALAVVHKKTPQQTPQQAKETPPTKKLTPEGKGKKKGGKGKK